MHEQQLFIHILCTPIVQVTLQIFDPTFRFSFTTGQQSENPLSKFDTLFPILHLISMSPLSVGILGQYGLWFHITSTTNSLFYKTKKPLW